MFEGANDCKWLYVEEIYFDFITPLVTVHDQIQNSDYLVM